MKWLLALFFILRTGIASGQTLSPDQMRSDLSILRSAWENLHPGLYRYNTPDQIQAHFADASVRTANPMSQRDFFIILSQLNIKLKCGHTFVSFYNQKSAIEDKIFSKAFFPLLFRVLNKEFVITHNLSEIPSLKAGDRILKINGIPVPTILDSLLTVSKADGNNGLNKKLDNISLYPADISPKKYTLFDIFFPLFFKSNLNDSEFKITVVNTRKEEREFTLAALTKEKRQAIYVDRFGILPAQEKSWNVKPIDKNTVVFRLGDFAVYNWKFDFRKYLDSVFTVFQQAGYKNLILDIRQNEGGSDVARDEVLSYIITKPITCYNQIRRLYRYLQIPDSLLPYLKTWDNSFKEPKKPELFRYTSNNLYEEISAVESCNTLQPKSNRFTGRTFLVTDVTNSSATFSMADIVKKERLATIVGEETGGTQQGINGGQIFFLYLPNSSIEMDLPLVYQTSIEERQDKGIEPDFLVKTTYHDIAKSGDPQLDFILKKLVPKNKK